MTKRTTITEVRPTRPQRSEGRVNARPNFSAVVRTMRDDLEAEARDLDRWRAEIEQADAAVCCIGSDAEQACLAIGGAVDLSPGEVVAICCALYRQLDKQRHIETHRQALASLSDIVSDFAGEAEQQQEGE
jgi:hypothetical protein